MFGPIVDRVDATAARARRNPLGIAGVAVGTMLLASLALALTLRPADAVALSADGGAVPVVAVALVAGDAVIAQTESQDGVSDHGHGPVDLVAVTVADGGQRLRLIPRPGAVDVVDVGYPEDLDGVAISENGAQTPAGTAGFEVAVSRAFTSTDLRDYLLADDEDPGSGWGHDLDLAFDRPLTGDQFLVVQERNGNSRVRLTPLDESALPFATSRPVEVEPPYDWNTGYAPGDTNPAQPVHLAVFDVDDLLAAAAVEGVERPTTIDGLRIETNDGADVKVSVFVDESSEAANPELVAPTGGPEPTVEDGPPALPTGMSSVAALGGVYAGHDGGASCAGAPTFIEATPGQAVTYCVTVTNTGSTPLSGVAVSAPTLPVGLASLSTNSAALGSGDAATYFAEATPPVDEADGEVDETFVVTATVSAEVAASASGAGAAELEITATTDIVAFPPEEEESIAPDVALAASAHAGTDTGIACAADADTAGDDGPLTRCFTVTNTGNTHLDSIEVSDPAIDGTPELVESDSDPLAPGDSAVFALQTPTAAATGASDEPSVVTANAVDSSGADLVGVGDVSAADAVSSEAETPTPAQIDQASAAASPAASTGAQPAANSTAPAANITAPAAHSTAPGADDQGSASATEAGTTRPATRPAPAASARALSEGAGTANAEAPTELAFTGWETWVIAITGMVLVAAGYLLLYPEHAYRLRAFATGELGEPVGNYFDG